MSLGRSAPNLTAMACFVVLALVEPNSEMLRPGPVFAAVNVFLALRAPLIMIPETIMHAQHIAVSFARITHFLLLPESAPPPKPPPGTLRIRKGDVVIGVPANARFELVPRVRFRPGFVAVCACAHHCIFQRTTASSGDRVIHTTTMATSPTTNLPRILATKRTKSPLSRRMIAISNLIGGKAFVLQLITCAQFTFKTETDL